jgi:hypothetical protein
MDVSFKRQDSEALLYPQDMKLVWKSKLFLGIVELLSTTRGESGEMMGIVSPRSIDSESTKGRDKQGCLVVASRTQGRNQTLQMPVIRDARCMRLR